MCSAHLSLSLSKETFQEFNKGFYFCSLSDLVYKRNKTGVARYSDFSEQMHEERVKSFSAEGLTFTCCFPNTTLGGISMLLLSVKAWDGQLFPWFRRGIVGKPLIKPGEEIMKWSLWLKGPDFIKSIPGGKVEKGSGFYGETQKPPAEEEFWKKTFQMVWIKNHTYDSYCTKKRSSQSIRSNSSFLYHFPNRHMNNNLNKKSPQRLRPLGTTAEPFRRS